MSVDSLSIDLFSFYLGEFKVNEIVYMFKKHVGYEQMLVHIKDLGN